MQNAIHEIIEEYVNVYLTIQATLTESLAHLFLHPLIRDVKRTKNVQVERHVSVEIVKIPAKLFNHAHEMQSVRFTALYL
jgi:hypothetical protein